VFFLRGHDECERQKGWFAAGGLRPRLDLLGDQFAELLHSRVQLCIWTHN
jgi:hypothetical protein